jgi:hypothetical protein
MKLKCGHNECVDKRRTDKSLMSTEGKTRSQEHKNTESEDKLDDKYK